MNEIRLLIKSGRTRYSKLQSFYLMIGGEINMMDI